MNTSIMGSLSTSLKTTKREMTNERELSISYQS